MDGSTVLDACFSGQTLLFTLTDSKKNGTDSIFDIICVECERDPVLKHYGTTESEPGVRTWVCSTDSFHFYGSR